MWKIDFVDDAVTEREPEAGTTVIRSANAVLGAGCPAQLNPWRPVVLYRRVS